MSIVHEARSGASREPRRRLTIHVSKTDVEELDWYIASVTGLGA